jgi:hypothetical protein
MNNTMQEMGIGSGGGGGGQIQAVRFSNLTNFD